METDRFPKMDELNIEKRKLDDLCDQLHLLYEEVIEDKSEMKIKINLKIYRLLFLI